MADLTPTINGQRIERMVLTVGQQGPWLAELWMEQDPQLSGQVTIQHGTTALVGTVQHVGSHASRTSLTVVAGRGQWGKVLPPKDYHMDTGVRAALVFADLCRETGEQAGNFAPAQERVGKDLVRAAVAASTVLESIIGGAQWWVDYGGITHVGHSTPGTFRPKDLLAYDPVTQTVELALDDLQELRVGVTLESDRLAQPVAVQSYRITIGPEGIRAACQAVHDIPALLRQMIRHEMGSAAPQLRKYRVVQMKGDLVELQVATQAIGYPDLTPIQMWPGVAGAHAELSRGCEVLVAFIDGDRAQPVIVGFVGKGGSGHAPVKLTFNSAVEIKGTLKADGEITAGALNPATKVTLTKHTHPTGTGPSGPATPGT